MLLPHPFIRSLRHLWTVSAFWLAALPSLAMAGIPVPMDYGEAAVQSEQQVIRLATVAYRLSLSNALFCEAMFALHSGPDLRDDNKDRLAKRAAAPGTPRDTVGLVADNHSDMESQWALVRNYNITPAEAILDGKLLEGAVTLRVLENDVEPNLDFVAQSSCPATVALIEDDAINAWADGTSIRITTGLLTRCESDDDLALVLGHEMAHNLLWYRQRLVGQGSGASGLLPASGEAAQELHNIEEEADRLAVSLALAANYDLSRAAEFMDGLLDRSIVVSASHPDPDRRLALLREAIALAQSGQSQQPSPES